MVRTLFAGARSLLVCMRCRQRRRDELASFDPQRAAGGARSGGLAEAADGGRAAEGECHPPSARLVAVHHLLEGGARDANEPVASAALRVEDGEAHEDPRRHAVGQLEAHLLPPGLALLLEDPW